MINSYLNLKEPYQIGRTFWLTVRNQK